jgi:hypothetical protein
MLWLAGILYISATHNRIFIIIIIIIIIITVLLLVGWD